MSSTNNRKVIYSKESPSYVSIGNFVRFPDSQMLVADGRIYKIPSCSDSLWVGDEYRTFFMYKDGEKTGYEHYHKKYWYSIKVMGVMWHFWEIVKFG